MLDEEQLAFWTCTLLLVCQLALVLLLYNMSRIINSMSIDIGEIKYKVQKLDNRLHDLERLKNGRF